MTRTDDRVQATVRKVTRSISDLYEKVLPEGGDEVFFEELERFDEGLTKRLARRPIDNMEMDMVGKKAASKFKEMCKRCKDR